MKFADELLDISGPRVSLARIISRFTAAPLFNLYVGIIIAVTSPIGLGPVLSPIQVILLCALVMVILPVAPIILDAQRGRVDLDVSERAMRPRFLLFAIGCYLLAGIIFWLAECHVMLVLSLAYASVTTGILLTTFQTKVSVHCAGVGGPGIAMIIMYGVPSLVVVFIWILVVWSRPVLQQHSYRQSILGLIVGIMITIATYLALW